MPFSAARLCSHVACVIILIISGPAAGADISEPTIAIDVEAKKIVNNFAAYHARLNGFRVTIESRMSAERIPFKQSTVQRLSASRPNKLSCLTETSNGALSDRVVVNCDGANVTAEFADIGRTSVAKYAVEKALGNWQAFSTSPGMGVLSMATLVPIPVAIFADDPAALLLSQSKTVTYVGREKLDGVECHVIRSVSNASTEKGLGGLEWLLWIDTGEKPLVRQSKVTSGAKAPKAMTGKLAATFIGITVVAVFKDWELNPSFPDDAFTYVRPEGAVQVDSVLQVLARKSLANKKGPR